MLNWIKTGCHPKDSILEWGSRYSYIQVYKGECAMLWNKTEGASHRGRHFRKSYGSGVFSSGSKKMNKVGNGSVWEDYPRVRTQSRYSLVM